MKTATQTTQAVIYGSQAELTFEGTRAALPEARARGIRLGRRPMAITHPEFVARVRQLHAEGHRPARIAGWHDMTVGRALSQKVEAA